MGKLKKLLRWFFKAVGGLLAGMLVILAITYLYENIRTPGYQKLSDQQIADHIDQLNIHGQGPNQYITSKFKDHDVVIIGEPHGLTENYQFLINLLEPLSSNGVKYIAMEFFLTADQYKMDSLLTANTFDKKLARQIVITKNINLLYQEFYDLLHRTWELNQAGSDLHILNLYRRQDRDRHMATLVDSVANLGEKVLVYCGNMHALTKFSQPLPDFIRYYYNVQGDNRYRMGNLLMDEFEKNPFFVNLHFAQSKKLWFIPLLYWKMNCLGFSGVLDQVFDSYDQPVGFDSDLERLGYASDNFSWLSAGKGEIQLADFCNGYIYLRPITGFHSAQLLEGLAETSEERKYIQSRIPERQWHYFESEQSAQEFFRSEGFPPEEVSQRLDLRGLKEFSFN